MNGCSQSTLAKVKSERCEEMQYICTLAHCFTSTLLNSFSFFTTLKFQLAGYRLKEVREGRPCQRSETWLLQNPGPTVGIEPRDPECWLAAISIDSEDMFDFPPGSWAGLHFSAPLKLGMVMWHFSQEKCDKFLRTIHIPFPFHELATVKTQWRLHRPLSLRMIWSRALMVPSWTCRR